MEIYNWVINALIFSLPFSWYLTYQSQKSIKIKDDIIEKLTNAYLRKHGD